MTRVIRDIVCPDLRECRSSFRLSHRLPLPARQVYWKVRPRWIVHEQGVLADNGSLSAPLSHPLSRSIFSPIPPSRPAITFFVLRLCRSRPLAPLLPPASLISYTRGWPVNRVDWNWGNTRRALPRGAIKRTSRVRRRDNRNFFEQPLPRISLLRGSLSSFGVAFEFCFGALTGFFGDDGISRVVFY